MYNNIQSRRVRCSVKDTQKLEAGLVMASDMRDGTRDTSPSVRRSQEQAGNLHGMHNTVQYKSRRDIDVRYTRGAKEEIAHQFRLPKPD